MLRYTIVACHKLICITSFTLLKQTRHESPSNLTDRRINLNSYRRQTTGNEIQIYAIRLLRDILLHCKRDGNEMTQCCSVINIRGFCEFKGVSHIEILNKTRQNEESILIKL